MNARFIGLTFCIILISTQISSGQNTWVKLYGDKGDEEGMSKIDCQ